MSPFSNPGLPPTLQCAPVAIMQRTSSSLSAASVQWRSSARPNKQEHVCCRQPWLATNATVHTCGNHAEVIQQLERCINPVALRQQAHTSRNMSPASSPGLPPKALVHTCGHHAEVVQQLERRIGRAMLRQQARVTGGQRRPPRRGRGSAGWPRCCDMLEHQRHSLRWPQGGKTVSRERNKYSLQQSCTLIIAGAAAALSYRHLRVLSCQHSSLRCSA